MQNSRLIDIFRSSHFWGFALVFLIVNFLKLDNSSMYLDEAYSLYYTQQDFAGLSSIFAREANPPLYYIMLFGWVHTFGASVLTGRLLSLLFSTVLLIVAGGWLNKRFGLLSSVIFCLLYISNPTVIDMSMEMRTFALTALLVFLSTVHFVAFYEKKKTLTFLLFAGFSLVALYSHLNAVFPIGLLGILLLFTPTKSIYKFGFFALLALGTLPLLYFLSDAKLSSTSSWMAVPGWKAIKIEFFTLGSTWLYTILFLLAAIASSLIVKLKKPEYKFTWIVFITLAMGSWFASFMVSQSIPVFQAKYLYFTLPFFIILVAIAVHYLSQKISPRLKGIVVIAFAATFANGIFSWPVKSEDWKGVVDYISATKTEDHLVMVAPGYMYRPFGYYYSPEDFAQRPDLVEALYPKGVIFIDQLSNDLFEYIKPKKIIYVLSHQQVVDPNWDNMKFLNDRYTYISEKSFAGIRTFSFAESP